MKNPKLGASVLSVPSFELKEKIVQLEQAGVDYFHVDIMDGNFVPNISMPPSLYADMFKTLSNSFFDLHFMVSQKALINLLPIYLQFPPKYVTIHEEASEDWSDIAKQVRAKGARFGLALNPETPISTIQNCLSSLDLVLLMSVVPGRGGQKFLDSTYQKLQVLNDLREKNHLTFLIQLDGGINLEISKNLISKGADLLVIGSDLIKDPNPVIYINQFRDL